jgi:hypothetical protein
MERLKISYTGIVKQVDKIRYATILRNLGGFDDWLTGLGVQVRQSDRAHNAIRILERAEHAFVNRIDGASAGISNSEYLFSLTEALELQDVYLAFRNHPTQALRERLTRALSGPVLPEAETPKNRDGRNVMFELALGAEWALLGTPVELLEPDLLLRAPNANYLVACKRPDHEHGIRAAVRSAARQLRSALSASPNNYLGIIAVSLSSALNRGRAFFAGGYEQLSEHLNVLMAKHRPTWRTTDFHSRNIAILFHAHTPADWGDGLFRLSAALVGPTLREGAVHQGLKDDLTRLYSVADAGPVEQKTLNQHRRPQVSRWP